MQWHNSMRFTVEVGGKSLPFLDLNLDVTNNNLSTTVYRKPTYTSLLLNYQATCPPQWKRGLILTLVNRAYVVCNSWLNFDIEIKRLLDIFSNNGYPKSFFLNTVKSYLDKKFSAGVPKSDTKYTHIMKKIPFPGIQSVYFKKRLQSIFRKIDQDLNIRWVFVCPKIKQYFSNKDRTPLALQSSVVYQFTCEVDPRITYIGKTYRHLNVRIKEHQSKISAIYDHRLNCQCSCNSQNFKIIDSANDNFSLNIMESVHIKSINPVLNTQLKYNGAFFNCSLL